MSLMHGLTHGDAGWLVRALGWTLLHFCWQGIGVAVVLWCVLRLVGARASRTRYGVSCLALLLLVGIPVATFGRLYAEARALQAIPVVTALEVSVTTGGGGMATEVAWTDRVAAMLDRAAPALPMLWLGGMVLFLLRFALGMMFTRRMRRSGTAAPHGLEGVFRQMAGRLGVRRMVELMHSARVQVPTVIGWLKPVVLIPAGCLTGLSEMQIEALLAHELAHIRRHDYLVSVAQSVVEAVLFYHPAVWWVSKQMRRERECCCDALAVEMGGNALAYAKALSALEVRRSYAPEVALGANGGVLTMRIRRLLGYRESSVGSQVAAALVLAIMVGAGAVTVAKAARAQATADLGSVEQSVPAGPGVDAVPDPRQRRLSDPQRVRQKRDLVSDRNGGMYHNWLVEDVVWIITPEEREAFRHLSNDDERDQFIAQFWARRNAPGAAEGTYRQEHYARIAYANEHFAANEPGWKTDRGHVYIVYGKPDAIDSHPSGDGAGGAPYEVWHYTEARAVMFFVDACRCGEYKLLPSNNGAPDGVNHTDLEPLRREPATFILSAKASALATMGMLPALAAPLYNKPEPYGRVRVPAEMMARSLLSHPSPVYPADAKALGIQGSVVLNAVIDTDGKVKNVAVVSGPAMLMMSAMQAVVGWKYRAPVVNGHPVEVATAITVEYALPEAPASPLKEAESVSQASSIGEQGIRAIGGVVIDPTGAVVANAAVTATSSETGVKTSVRTDGGGRFSFTLLADERYDVAADVPGFKRLLMTVAKGAQATGLTLRLQVGSLEERVDVGPGPTGRGTGNGVQSPSGLARVSGGAMAGNLVSRPDPVYPAEAKAARVQGAVVLHALISKTGAIENLNVVSGPEALRASAVDAVRRWTYKPYLLNGQPTEVDTTITVNFTFGGESPYPAPGKTAPVVPSVAGGGRPQRVSSGVMAGTLISRPDPVYPADAKAARISGAVVLRAVISKEGLVEDLQVVSGPEMLAASAIDAVRQWRYKPYLLNGEPTEVETTVTVNFSLGGAAAGNGARQARSNDTFAGMTDAELMKQANDLLAAKQYEAAYAAAKRLIEMYPDSQMVREAQKVRTAAAESLDLERQKTVQQQRQDAAAGVRSMGPGVSPPKVLKSVDPEYSQQARQDKVGGNVLVTAVVDERGLPMEVQVLRGMGHGLDAKAIEAVRQYKFRPAMENGVPVKVRLNIEVNFQIF